MKTAGFRFVFSVWAIWRAGLFLIAALAPQFLSFQPRFAMSGWLGGWGNFDGWHYLSIAQFGYNHPGSQDFFPLYPILIKLFAPVMGGYFLAGLLISNLAIIVAALLLYRLVQRDFDNGVARWAVAFLFAFPTSFYFASLYTESLFLALILAAFYFRGIFGGVFGAFAGLTRLIGSFFSIATAGKNFVGSVVSLLGIIGYMIYLKINFNDPLGFLTAQSSFANARSANLRTLIIPPQVIYRYLKILITADPGHYDFWIAVLELTAFTFACLLLAWLTVRQKKIRPYLIFAWLALLLPTFTGTLLSMPRFLLTIFPLYLGLALIKNRRIKVAALVIFQILLAVLSSLFLRGYWVS